MLYFYYNTRYENCIYCIIQKTVWVLRNDEYCETLNLNQKFIKDIWFWKKTIWKPKRVKLGKDGFEFMGEL